MPGGNRMGPMGNGPMTGRSFGFCTGNATPGNPAAGNRWMDRGMAFGGGRRRGGLMAFGRGFGFSGQNWSAPLSEKQELASLKQQSETLSRSLEAVKKRINELEAEQ